MSRLPESQNFEKPKPRALGLVTLRPTLTVFGGLAFALGGVNAAELNLAWTNPTSKSGIAGYQVAYGKIKGRYTSFHPVAGDSSTRTAVLPGLVVGSTYYLAVRSCAAPVITCRTASPYSNEVVKTITTADTTAPTVSISRSTSTDTYSSPLSVAITATASDSGGVKQVEFYDGATRVATDTSAPYTYAWSVTSAANGTHKWTARAYDNSNNVEMSTALTLNVNIATTSVPAANFTAAGLSTCTSGSGLCVARGKSVTFTDTSTGTVGNRSWNLGDGATTAYTSTVVSTSYSSTGVKTTTLTVAGAGVTKIATKSFTVVAPTSGSGSTGDDSTNGGSNDGGATGILSDDFNTSGLDPIWMVEDPLGNGSYALVGTGTQNAQLRLNVPAGTNHDIWNIGGTPVNRSVRVMQAASDDDFGLEVKFESQPTAKYQMQGLLVEQNATNFLRVDFIGGDGKLRVFAARFVNGVPTKLRDVTIPAGTKLYLRLKRAGDTWTPQYSYNGTSWIGVSPFTHKLAVSAVGVFAGKAGTAPPAFTAVVDYFFNTAARIVPEN